jgi:hypothetical protein
MKVSAKDADSFTVKLDLKSRRLVAMSLAFGLSVLGALWWLGIWWSPSVRSHFDVPNARWWLDGMAIADVLLFVVGHGMVGLMILKRNSKAQLFAGVTAGATAYAWLNCVGMLRFHGSVLATAAMFGAAVASFSLVLVVGDR